MSNTKRVVCYYANWAIYKEGSGKFTPDNIDPDLCTHLIYAFAKLTDQFNIEPFDHNADISRAGYSKFNGLKEKNWGLKTLLSIGGWNEGSERFSNLVTYSENRRTFTQSVLNFLRIHNFDGIDLAWEYPCSREGSRPQDKRNYAVLCKELREAFKREGSGKLLTMAVPGGQEIIDMGYDIPALNKYLDFFNVMTYDYYSSYDPKVNHHAPLFPKPGTAQHEYNYRLNIDWTIKHYLSKGADVNKLVVGIPSYGRSFTLSSGQANEIGSTAIGPGIQGRYTKEDGVMSYYEVREAISFERWEVRKPYPTSIGPYAFRGNQWVGYDDEDIVAKKAAYVKRNNLGGIMFWTIDMDDFRGIGNDKKFPLIEAGKSALN